MTVFAPAVSPSSCSCAAIVGSKTLQANNVTGQSGQVDVEVTPPEITTFDNSLSGTAMSAVIRRPRIADFS